MSGYTKLFGSILESTVWMEDLATKVVWITLLAMADQDGNIEASVPGLAKRAGVERFDCERALAIFLAPDPDSRTPEFEGRRLVAIHGGWHLLNHAVYRHRASMDEVREKGAARQRKYIEKKRGGVSSVSMTKTDDIAEAEAEAEAKNKDVCAEASSAPAAMDQPPFLVFPVIGPRRGDWQLSEAQVAEWASLFGGLDVRGECRKALAWLHANKGRRKTDRGMQRFLVSWLSRAVDSPRAAVMMAPVSLEPQYFNPWCCPHVTPCGNRAACKNASALGRPEKVQAARA